MKEPREYWIRQQIKDHKVWYIEQKEPNFSNPHYDHFKVIEYSAYEKLHEQWRTKWQTALDSRDSLHKEIEDLEKKYFKLKAQEVNGTLRTYDGVVTELEEKLKIAREAMQNIKLKSLEEVSNLEESDAKLSRCYEYSRNALEKIGGE